jgi:spermidine synthase
MADLFTRDFYETAASKLRPGGIFCQWVQCYQTSPATLRTIFRTLATRFPKGQLFFVDGSADLVILASPDREIGLDLDQLGKWFGDEKVAKNLARVGVSSLPDLMRYYRGRLDRVAREADGGPINTDDNGWLEHKAPFDLLAGTTSEGEMAWSPDVAADLAGSITSDRDRAAEVLAEAAARAKAAGNEGAAIGLAMGRKSCCGDRPRPLETRASDTHFDSWNHPLVGVVHTNQSTETNPDLSCTNSSGPTYVSFFSAFQGSPHVRTRVAAAPRRIRPSLCH